MKITIKPPANNTKNILTLLEEAGYTLPCNCHGARLCNGRQYSFDCSMVPQNTVTVSLEKETESIEGLSLTPDSPSSLMADAVLVDIGTTTIALSLINTEHKNTCFLILCEPSAEFWKRCDFPHPKQSPGKFRLSETMSVSVSETRVIHTLPKIRPGCPQYKICLPGRQYYHDPSPSWIRCIFSVPQPVYCPGNFPGTFLLWILSGYNPSLDLCFYRR